MQHRCFLGEHRRTFAETRIAVVSPVGETGQPGHLQLGSESGAQALRVAGVWQAAAIPVNPPGKRRRPVCQSLVLSALPDPVCPGRRRVVRPCRCRDRAEAEAKHLPLLSSSLRFRPELSNCFQSRPPFRVQLRPPEGAGSVMPVRSIG